jgi:hypothetical protein
LFEKSEKPVRDRGKSSSGLRGKSKINRPLKSRKNTSATLIRGSDKFASLESLFLGHAGGTLAHRHYAKAPQELLDQAIDWLATEYGIE